MSVLIDFAIAAWNRQPWIYFSSEAASRGVGAVACPFADVSALSGRSFETAHKTDARAGKTKGNGEADRGPVQVNEASVLNNLNICDLLEQRAPPLRSARAGGKRLVCG